MSKPFYGFYSLSKKEKLVRALGKRLGRDPVSKILRSFLKNLVNIKSPRPRDVTVFGSQNVRLHPYDNICEKRVFLTPHLWEEKERKALSDFISGSGDNHFYFLDAGANVGLYSFFARAICQKTDKIFHSACIEPGERVRARLEFNIQSAGARTDIQVFPIALSNKKENVHFRIRDENLGESKIIIEGSDHHNRTKIIPACPLHDIIIQTRFPRLDALKIDIEGHELVVMEAFFNNAPPAMTPAIIIVEIAHQKEKSDLHRLLENNKYELHQQSRGNRVYKKFES